MLVFDNFDVRERERERDEKKRREEKKRDPDKIAGIKGRNIDAKLTRGTKKSEIERTR